MFRRGVRGYATMITAITFRMRIKLRDWFLVVYVKSPKLAYFRPNPSCWFPFDSHAFSTDNYAVFSCNRHKILSFSSFVSDEENSKWWFSIVDVVAAITDSPNPRKYWSVLKTRLKKAGSELTTRCSQLKMTAADGKRYATEYVNCFAKLSQTASTTAIFMKGIDYSYYYEQEDYQTISVRHITCFRPQL